MSLKSGTGFIVVEFFITSSLNDEELSGTALNDAGEAIFFIIRIVLRGFAFLVIFGNDIAFFFSHVFFVLSILSSLFFLLLE